MGQTADELRQEVDSKRDDASQKIEQLEQMVTGAADQVKTQVSDAVDQAKAQVKQTFDWRHQVEEKPLVALGAAFIGGVVLGGVLGGDDGHQEQRQYGAGYYGAQSGDPNATRFQYQYQPPAYAGQSAGVMGALRGAAKKAGLDQTIANMSDNLFSTISERIKQVADDAFPGMGAKMSNAMPGGGSQQSGSFATSGMGSSSSVGSSTGSGFSGSSGAGLSGSGSTGLGPSTTYRSGDLGGTTS